MVADDPHHRSRQAELPHWAPASGDDAHAAQGIGMTYASRRQPLLNEPSHAFPGDSAFVAPPSQGRIIAITQVGGLHHRYMRAA